MVLPLVGGVVAGAGFIYNMISADKNNAQAKNITIKALNKMGQAQREQAEQEEKTKLSLEKLANRKRGILSTSIKNFIGVYENIMQIDFVESDGIRELSFNAISTIKVDELKRMICVADMPMKTGEIIATMLIRGYGFLGGISGVIAKESEINVSIASMRKKQANVIASQAETNCVALDAIYQRAERLSELLARLNRPFMKSIAHTKNIIEEKGENRLNYSQSDKEAIMTCINFASAIKSILDVPLIDNEGTLTELSIQAIKTGEEYLNKLEKAVS